MKFPEIKCLLICFAMSCVEQSDKAPPVATLFEAELISSELPEFATSIDTHKSWIYFNRTAADRSTMQIFESKYEDGQWTEPKPLPFSTGQYRDVDPFLSLDGNRLYFSSDRPTPITAQGNWDTWYLEKLDSGWSAPINAGEPLNSDSTEIFISIAANGNAYFVSERDGTRGIVVSHFKNNTHTLPIPIRPKLRGEQVYASNPCISSDERFLIVAIRDPEGNQTPDLFISFNENGEWSEFQNLGTKVNHPDYADFAPGLSKDDNILFFTSERPGIMGKQPDGVRPPGDIYWVNLELVLASLKNE